jgi:polar amino acid transport system substrate-binding protein
MLLLRRSLLLACALACLGKAPARAETPKPLVFCFENTVQQPWSTPSGEGLNFELLKRVEKQLGEHFIYAAKPWRRCMEELRIGMVDSVIAAADIPERHRFAVYPTLPDGRTDPARALFEDNIYVFLRVGGQASWNGRQLISPNREVGLPSGYAIATLVRQQGLIARDMIKSPEDGLRMLASGMFDAVILEGAQAANLARQDPRFQGKVMQAQPPYAVLDLHLPVSRQTYERDPQRIEAIWRAIATVRQSAEYRQLASQAAR